MFYDCLSTVVSVFLSLPLPVLCPSLCIYYMHTPISLVYLYPWANVDVDVDSDSEANVRCAIIRCLIYSYIHMQIIIT